MQELASGMKNYLPFLIRNANSSMDGHDNVNALSRFWKFVPEVTGQKSPIFFFC